MATISTSTQNEWIENFARFGYAAKGVVYCLLGILAVTAAFGSGSTDNTDKENILSLIMGQPFGKFLLAVVAIGLSGYAMWRGIEAFKDPHNHGKSTKAIFKRIGYSISAIVYVGIAFSAFKIIFNGSQGDGGGGSSQQALIGKLLEQPFGQWLVGIVALIILLRGIQQVVKAVSGKYRKGLKERKIDNKYKRLLVRSGEAGYIARGLVWGIVAFLFFRAAIHANAGEAGSTEDALGFIHSDFGPWILATIALGLFCYGIFFILQAIYVRIPV